MTNTDKQNEIREKLKEMEMQKFINMSDTDQMKHLNEKLVKHNEFLADMKGSGRTYYSEVQLKDEEFQWIMKKLNQLK